MSPSTFAVKLNGLIERAIARLPGPSQRALRALGGLDDSTAGFPLGLRREAAAEALGVAASTFRTHREARLVEELAQVLVIELSDSWGEMALTREPEPSQVLVLHAKDAPARKPLFDLLQAWGLHPIGFSDLVSPAAGTAVEAFATAVRDATAIVVLVSPPTEDLMLELGFAIGAAPERTLIVSHGTASIPSTLHSWSILRLDNRPTSRNVLRSHLQALGCKLGDSLGWLDPAIGGDFGSLEDASPVIGGELENALLNRYEPESRLGEGALGGGWRARDRWTGERAVVRVFKAPDATFQRSLQKRIDMAASAGAEALPTLREVVKGDREVAAVLDAVDGITLEEVGQLSTEESLRIVLELLGAISSLQQCGVMHRDISPENVLLAEGGRVKLIDFGSCGGYIDGGNARRETWRGRDPAGTQWADTYAIARLFLFLTLGREARDSAREELDAVSASAELKGVLARALLLGPAPHGSAAELLDELEAAPEASGFRS